MEGRLLTLWRIALFAIFCLSVYIYVPSMNGGAIWDDTELISGSGFGKNTFLSAFTHPFLRIYFRPLTSASFVLDSTYSRSTPFFYHETNILLHALTAVLIACLALSITKRQTAGIFAGLFFAAQPIQVDATAWIGGRTDVLSSLFVAAFMLSLVRYHQTDKKKWLVGSVAAFFLAAITKEQAIALFPAIPLSVFVFGSKKWSDARRLTIPFAVAVLLFIAFWCINAPAPSGALSSIGDTITVALRTAALYGLSFFAPHNRSLLSWTLENYRGPFWILTGAALVVAAAYILRLLWLKNKPLAWVAVCALLVYIPISNFPSVPTLTVAPYRCSESGTAVACLFGAGLAWAIAQKKWLLTVPFVANLVAGTLVTCWGVSVWTSEFNFFEQAARNDHHFIAGVTHYAEALNGKNRWKESIQWSDGLLTWLFGTPDWAHQIEVEKNAAITPEVRQRIHTNSGKPDPRTLGYIVSLIGASLADLHRTSEAIPYYEDALVISPTDPRVNYSYGKIILKTNRREAIRHWEIALHSSPKFPLCAAALAHERIIDHNYKDAVRLLEPAMESVGWNCDTWVDLADAKIGLQDYAGASAALDQAEKSILVIKPHIQARRDLIRQRTAQKM